MNKMINFTYKENNYSLEICKYGIPCALYVDYERKCGSSSDDCDHDYGRCMVITNISKGLFNLENYLKSYLIGVGDISEEVHAETLSQIKSTLKGIDFQEYINCEAEDDYYGHTLEKSVPEIAKLTQKIVEAIQCGPFTKILVTE